MKEYPTIGREIIRGEPFYLFVKYDGSSLRATYSRKQGFYKFGSRHCLLGEDNILLGEGIELFKNKYEKDLSDIFKRDKYDQATVFFEFFGENSFAGNHMQEPHDVILFDVAPYKRGILYPREFIKTYGNLDIPKMVYYGNITTDIELTIRESRLSNISFEGCVAKAHGKGKTLEPRMFKIKTNAWLDKLKSFCKDNINLYNKLL